MNARDKRRDKQYKELLKMIADSRYLVPYRDLFFELDERNNEKNKTEREFEQDYLTEEESKRDKQTTALYTQYVESHKEKCKFVADSKKRLLNWSLGWVTALVVACIGLPIIIFLFTPISTDNIIALISAVIPIVGAIIGTLTVIIKYVFPENEEQHITAIVKQIQRHDLKNKQENLRQKILAKEPIESVPKNNEN